MPQIKQNLVILMKPTDRFFYHRFDISHKCGNMCLNRFCIDEEASFELSGVRFFNQSWKATVKENKSS